jgi:quinol-cytochrome oxidoreductase complex cytochrome b subunit
MERVRRLVGEMLVGCFLVVMLTGGFLAFFYSPDGQTVSYNGFYEPLRGVPMSGAYNSILEIGFDVRGGLLVRQLHHSSSILLVLGTVLWALLGRFRYALTVLGLGLLGALAGYGAADDLLSGTALGKLPIPLWYGLHLLVALAVGAVLVISSQREAARHPRTLSFVALSLGLTALAIFTLGPVATRTVEWLQSSIT